MSEKLQLELVPITLTDKYRLKWNTIQKDFVMLKNGEILNGGTLYRVGGFNTNLHDDYFVLVKHVEAFYPDSITKDKKRKPHLEGRWCILDKSGIEKIEFKQFETPYVIDDSVIYCMDDKYYNIETGELYCKSYTSMESSKFLFLDTKYDKDKSKRGVMKINKKTGEFEVFK